MSTLHKAEDFATEAEMQEWAQASVYPPHVINKPVTITIRSPDQINALSSYLAQIIRDSSIEFKQCQADARSSTAIDCAVANGFANEIVLQLRQIWMDIHDGESPDFLETNDEKIERLRNPDRPALPYN